MTSRTGVDGILRELHFGSAQAPAGAAPRAFGFALDFDSALHWPDLPYDTSAPAAWPDGAQRARMRAVLDETAQLMAARVPSAHALVNEQMQHVLLRCSDRSPGTSTSHRNHVGWCLLTNLHQPAQAVAVAVEALTHESIHQLLYRTEAAEGPFCDLAETPTFRSPWSGARLPLHSLVHASFVWFGLLTLWRTLAQSAPSDSDAAHARARVAHCLFGFAFLDDLLDSPAFPTQSVQPQVLAAMRAMAAATLRGTQAAEPAATLRQLQSSRQAAQWPAALAAGMAWL